MKVLVGCEESGVVRRAFEALGHDAWSNDLIDARDGSAKHLKMDVFLALEFDEWDIIILHPPCTALACSGNSTYGTGMPKNKERHEAKNWTARLWDVACKKAQKGVCLENPVGVLWGHIGVSPQYIHPYWFGHPEQKKTGLGLDRIPELVPTNDVYDQMMQLPKNQRERLHYMPPHPDRSKMRSETFKGVAEAMASQWGAI